MSARNKNSNFQNFQIGLVKILDKDSKHIFVMMKYDVLQKSYFNFEVGSLFQIQTLADVCVGFWFEFLFEKLWFSKYVVWSSSTN
jgi:hypothetical protein